MSLSVTTTEAADSDIRDIVSYIALDSPASARWFGVEIHDCFQRIAVHPEIGLEVTDLPSPLRRVRVSARFRRWLVFYRRLDARTLEVVRVLHGARDIPALFWTQP